VTAQIEAVAADIRLHAVKIGMLATTAIVEAVAAAVEALDLPDVIVDPVMLAKGGERLLDGDGVQAMITELLPRTFVVTPNLPEAEVLSGRSIGCAEDTREAARRIHGLGPSAVIITGGHSTGTDIVDLLFDGRTFHELRTPRIEGPPFHGTGCTFASALAAHVALGRSLVESAACAQAFVANAIRGGFTIGKGHGVLYWK
jgi:hydroxymethylpyrimidine/phosphomethylpyrimidine kinase